MSGIGLRRKGRAAAQERYGTLRSFTLRTLYSWLTLTILFAFTWPLLVVYAGAPGVAAEETPTLWFQVRVLIAVLSALAAAWLWRLSPAPAETARPERALALFRRGRIWPQVMVFLIGLSLLLSLVLLADDPARAVKVLSLGLAETLVVQILLAGYMQAVFDLLLDDYRAGLATAGLFAITFALRGGLAASTQDDLGQDLLVVSLLAGAVLGLAIGALTLWLRARSGSLAPGILTHWLLLTIVLAFLDT